MSVCAHWHVELRCRNSVGLDQALATLRAAVLGEPARAMCLFRALTSARRGKSERRAAGALTTASASAEEVECICLGMAGVDREVDRRTVHDAVQGWLPASVRRRPVVCGSADTARPLLGRQPWPAPCSRRAAAPACMQAPRALAQARTPPCGRVRRSYMCTRVSQHP
jgi:hypothetical protein